MRDVIETARRFRSNARRRGNPARAALARRYATVLRGVRQDATALERRVVILRNNGVTPSAELLRSLDETTSLRRRTELRLLEAADTAVELVDTETAREVTHALKDARALVALRRQGPSLADRLDETAVRNLVGNTETGPLRRLLTDRAGDDADRVADMLVQALMRDESARDVAPRIARLIEGSSMASALRIVRTETHRARREAARVVYARTSGVRGWVWVCSLTPTSCGLCWAQHGQVFTFSEPMATHPNCTCEVVPWFGEDVDTGVELFDALTPAEQDTALGAAPTRAYRAGALTLRDLVRTGRHASWGPVGAQASLVSVLGDRATDYYRA